VTTAVEPESEQAPVVGCMGVPISAYTRDSAARRVVEMARRARAARAGGSTGPVGATGGSDVHLCNAYTLAVADRDVALNGVLRAASLNLPDGQSVVWANRVLHRAVAMPSTRVYGPDLFLDVFALGEGIGLCHYLLGSTPEVLDALQRELRRRFPRARVAGAHSPPFRPLEAAESREQEEAIRAADPDVVWVGLGTPYQDRRCSELAAALPVVCVAVGAAFDFVAGNKRQAPRWIQRSGLEWLFRFGCEPRRLWRRYVFGNARFLRGVARQAFRRPEGSDRRGRGH
jgi:N-acetylglucosaminyldiphosphoundecaprenol N-acetyl-beta-D-mannosaminyltransferase